ARLAAATQGCSTTTTTRRGLPRAFRCSARGSTTTRSSRRSARARARRSNTRPRSRNGTRFCSRRPTGWSGEGSMTLSRRSLLKLALAGAAHPLLPVRGIVSQAFAAPGAGNAKFLLVFLRGGYDAANVVIPVGSPFYYESRPTIAIPKPDAANPLSALPLGADPTPAWGLHPALKESMLPLWRKGQLAFIPFAGTDDLPRSPFETQDSVEAGMPVAAPGSTHSTPHSYGSGFLNRLAAALDGTAAPVSFTDGLPTVMTGDVVVPNVSLKGTGRPGFDDRQMALLESMYAGTRFEPLIAEGFDLRKTVAEQDQ